MVAKLDSEKQSGKRGRIDMTSLMLAAAVSLALIVRDTQYNLAKNNIQLYVDGRLITSFYYNAATDRLTYTPPALLAYGTHTVRIVARDAAGNIKIQQWSFKVVR